jgi:SAM-dependent methyltransferase
MNADLSNDHPSIRYYDSDYPGAETARYAQNFDSVVGYQGIEHDIARYRELAAQSAGPILELCCGTGRVAIPLARSGFDIVGVDLFPAMLDRLRERLGSEPEPVAKRVTLVQQDVAKLSLDRNDFGLVILAFNSLLCLTDFDAQINTLQGARRHLVRGGRIAVDAINPLRLPFDGDPVPKPFFTRRSEASGQTYTRFAALGAFEATQRQRLHGWYDEILADGIVKRTAYEMHWRPIFRYELELMLRLAGFEIETIEGGHRHEPFTAESPKIFAVARSV